MKLFALTHKAKADLHSIAIFTMERWGVKQRNLNIKQLDEAFHMLARSPELGKSCDDIMPGYRKFPQGSHIVFYKDGSSSKIEVIRILHKNMDVDTQIYMEETSYLMRSPKNARRLLESITGLESGKGKP